ncbi:hypothetical protein EON65_31220 [archaeon]|nr:MAG: hypothetical protein EON65_31220 [archaeon]
MDHVENCITILHARYIKKVFEPLSEILASMQDLRNRAVESIGDGSVPSLPVMGDYSEVSWFV